MDAQIRTMIEQQLEAQNQRMAEMMTKLDELTKKRSLEVNKEVPSNPDRNSFKFLPNLEFPSFDGVNLEIGSGNVPGVLHCTTYLSPNE